MPNIEQSIIVRIKNIVEGLGDVQALSATVKGLGKTGGVPGLQSITRDAKNLGAQSGITTGQLSGLTVGLGRLTERAQKGGLGVFIKDLGDAARQLQQFTALEKLDPFQRANNVSLGSASKSLAANEAARLALNRPSNALEAGLAKHDPFQTAQNIGLARAAAELAAFDAEAAKSTGILSGLSFGTKDVTKSFLGMTVSGSGASAVFLSVASAAGLLVAALAAIGGALAAIGFAKFVAEGIRFNTVIESAKIGIATLVANTYDIKDAAGTLLDPVKSFNAALGESDQLERALQKSAIETKFEFEDILGFFNSTVIASAGLKTNLGQLVQLTQDFALAAGAANIEQEKVRTGIQQILTGVVTVRNPLARVLFPGETTKQINDTLKKFKEAGTLVDFLEDKLKVFRLSADQVSQSFEAVSSNVADAFKVFAAQSTLPLFDKLKQTLGFIITQVVDLSGDAVKLTPTFQKIADILGVILGFVGDRLLEAVQAVFEGLKSWVDYLYTNREALGDILLGLYTITEQVVGIGADLISILGDLGEANSSTSNWAKIVQVVAIGVGFIRDLLNVIIGSLEAIVGVMYAGIGNGIKAIGDGLQWLIDKTGAWMTGLQFVGQFLSSIGATIGLGGASAVNSGLDRFSSGFNGDNTGNALNRLGTPPGNIFKKIRTGGFNFTPRKGFGGDATGGGAAGKAARAEKERINALRKVFEAANELQLAFAAKELQIQKDTNALFLEGYQRRFEQGLLSAQEFYKKKQELEQNDLALEERNLKGRKAANAVKLENEVAAILGKKGFTESEFDALLERFKTADERFKTADATSVSSESTEFNKALTAYLKNREDEVKIDEQLAQIGIKRQKIESDVTFEIEKQARANRTTLDSLSAEFATSTGNEGLSELFNLQKRVSDEFPKILSETNATLPGIQNLVKALYEASEVDISNLPKLLDESGIKFGDLSDEARLFTKLLERLQTLAKIKSVSSDVSKAQDAFKFSTEGTSTDFANGKIGLSAALQQTSDAKIAATKALNDALERQRALLVELQTKGIATPQDVQNVESLRRAIEGLNNDYDKLALIGAQSDRNRNVLDQGLAEVENRRRAGDINGKQAKQEILALQQAQIASLNEELAALLTLDQTNLEVISRVAETRNKIGALRNDINADFLDFASNVNGQIGDAFSTFLNSIIEGTQSIGDAFRQLLASLLLGIAKAIAQALLLKFILEPLGLSSGSTGGIGGALSGLIFGKKAEGGIIRGSGTGVSDSAGLFALSHGEGVIPARRVSQYGAGFIKSIINGSFIPRIAIGGFASGGFPGGAIDGGRGGVRIVNSLDPNLVKDFMSSAAGEEIIVNVIGKNPNLVQRLV